MSWWGSGGLNRTLFLLHPGAAPIFQNTGLSIGSLQYWNNPQVIVFGWSTQPVLLPPNGAMPCLLVPSPDVLIASFASPQFTIPLPASLRPFQFWCQSVHLIGTDLRPGNCVHIDAF